MKRFSGPVSTLKPAVLLSRSISWGGTSWTMSTSPDSRAEIRVWLSAMTRYWISVTAGASPHQPSLSASTVRTSTSREDSV
ncbi:hypothetical protein D3C87_2097730 [compost metagenome]